MLCSADSHSLNSVVSEAFIRFFLETVGHFPLFMTHTAGGERLFQRDAFRKAVASRSVRRFLGVFMESQMFHGFIQDQELRTSRAKGETPVAYDLWPLALNGPLMHTGFRPYIVQTN